LEAPSLEDGSGFARVAELLRSHEMQGGSPPIAVVSAMSGVTDALILSLTLARTDGPSTAFQSLERHFERHMEVARALGPTAASKMRTLLGTARQEIAEVLGVGRAGNVIAEAGYFAVRRDAISSFGEALSAQLLTLVLNELGSPATYVDARCCIKTNAEHGNAKPLDRETALHTQATLQGLLGQKKLPVLGGFIGSTVKGATTTMGRGSSNHTATLISASLNARETQIWTDVSGVHTADPSLVEQARTISDLSYDEAEAMARLGAKVLHQRMFEPVRPHQIPIRILNSRSPQAGGTVISAQGANSKGSPATKIKAIAHRNHLVRIDVKSAPALVANGFQRSIEGIFERNRISIEFIARSSVGLSMVCDESAPLESIVPALERFGSVEVRGRQAVVSCIGEDLHLSSGAAIAIKRVLKAIDSTLEWQQMSDLNVVTGVDCGLVGSLVKSLHHEIFEQ